MLIVLELPAALLLQLKIHALAQVFVRAVPEGRDEKL